jgi:GTPase Era involved in 16S rRNA processing
MPGARLLEDSSLAQLTSYKGCSFASHCIATDDAHLVQVLLYDTPGLVDTPGQGNPVERLRSAWSTAALADQLLLIVDAERQVSS